MTPTALKEQLVEDLERLSPNQLERVYGIVHALVATGASIKPPTVTDPEERKRLLHELLDDMQRHPWPMNAPRLTRDELHERR